MRMLRGSKWWIRAAMALAVLVSAMALLSSDLPPFTARDKAFYADEATVNFVRPGLVFTIQAVSIAADGTVTTRFKMTDRAGQPLDRGGVTTPGVVASSFVIAKLLSDGGDYESYTTRLKTSTYPPTAGKQARQASSDTGGTYTQVADGVYDYRFGTKLPADYPKDATHTVGVYGSRNLTEFDLGTNYASDVYTFVPSGAAVKNVHNIISTSSCNKCHDDLNFHGGSRKGMPMCVLCHTPAYSTAGQTVSNLNPESNNTIDLMEMVHKIHAGEELPSVIAGQPYYMVGFGNAISNWSTVVMPSNIKRCQWCHTEGNTAPQKDFWMTKPSRENCGSCHDTVNFQTGAGHGGLPQFNDNSCKNCHPPVGELDFDTSVYGAHVLDTESALLQGLNLKIVSVENTRAGQKPVVNYQLVNNQGQVIPLTAMNRVAITLGGPVPEFNGYPPNGYVQESALTASTLSGNTYRYAMAATIPAGATGTWAVAMEARKQEIVYEGTLKQKTIQYGAKNPMSFFNVTGGTVDSRAAGGTTQQCNTCHAHLSLHGENRNQLEYCVMCHNPLMTDAAQRPAAQMPAEAIDMVLMTHRIHAGEEQTRTYTIYGFGGAAHNYNEVRYPAPGVLQNCAKCHTGDSEAPPARITAQIVDPRGYINPVYAATGACTGCHVSKEAASHALANTTSLGESCGVCHGVGKEVDVNKVHAQ